MKSPKFSWIAHRAAVITAVGAALATGHVFAADEVKSAAAKDAVTEADTTEYTSWIDLTTGYDWVRKDDAQFQAQKGQRADQPYGGISDLHIEQYLSKKTMLTIDGRIIEDNRDYLAKIGVANPDVGYARVGFKQYRTYYDGSGGYFPRNGQFFDLYHDDFGVDRGEVWLETGLTLPDVPVITLRVSHQYRNGMKDSTEWGDTAAIGLPAGTRNIVPSFYDIDEKRDTVELDVQHTMGPVEAGLGFRYEHLDQDNKKVETRTPGTVTARTITQEDEVKADLFNAHGYAEYRITDKVMVTLGGSFTTMDTDTGGSRVYNPQLPPPAGTRDEGFTGLGGGSEMKQYVANLSALITPAKNWNLVPALRVEHQCQNGDSEYGETASTNAPVPIGNTRHRDFLDVSESLDLRYTGLKNWVLSSGALLLQGQGNLREVETELDETPALVAAFRDTDSERYIQKYKAGANWYAHTRFNVAAQYYHERKANHYNNNADSTANSTVSADRYPAYIRDQNYDTDDMNVRATWRPWTGLTLVSRYDFQLATIDTRVDNLAQVQSGKATSHVFSESISWTPWSRLYFQGNGSYAYNLVTTPVDFISGTAANEVSKSQSGNWTASLLSGFVLSDKTDLQTQYTYYRASDYYNNANFSQPYGADDEEHSITASIIHRFNKNLQMVLRYGYVVYRDGASGGHNNYEAHMLASNLQYRF